MSILDLEVLTSPPVVGETYLVPSVYVSRYLQFVPILGTRHSDLEIIGFAPEHFHYDHRFTSELLYTRREANALLYVIIWAFKETIVKRSFVCMREQPQYPDVPFAEALREAYADKLVECKTCPHRGMPLGSLPREPGTNVVTCPGHGLRWDLTTGRIASRILRTRS